jgi:hypothetical protein
MGELSALARTGAADMTILIPRSRVSGVSRDGLRVRAGPHGFETRYALLTMRV